MTADRQGVLIEPNASEARIASRRASISERVRRAANKPPDPPAHPQTAEWLACERRRRDLEAQLKAVVSEQDGLRQRIIERWSMEGLDHEIVEGLKVHLRRKLYPKVSDKGRLAEALKKEGLTDLLTVDEKAFAIYVTACDENGVALPDPVTALVGESFERFDVAVRLK